MDYQFLKDLSFSGMLIVVVLYFIKVFAPMIRTAMEKIPDAINGLAKSNVDLKDTLIEVKQASKANAHAIGGLSETQSLTGQSLIKAIDAIAANLATAVQRQSTNLQMLETANTTGTKALEKLEALGGNVSAMEEMVGAILRTVLDVRDDMNILTKRPEGVTADDLKPLEQRLERAEQLVQHVIEQSKIETTPLPAGEPLPNPEVKEQTS